MRVKLGILSQEQAHLYSPIPVDHIRESTISRIVGGGNDRGGWVSSGKRDSHHDSGDRRIKPSDRFFARIHPMHGAGLGNTETLL